MKVLFSNIKEKENLQFNSTLDNFFDENSKICKKIISSDGIVSFEKVGDTLIAKFKINFNAIVLSSYTNEPFETVIKVNDELFFTDNKEMESDDIIYIENEIDIDEVVYSLFITSIPMNLHKKGEKLPSGNGYEVMKEEDFLNNLNSDSPFDKLKDLNFDD